MQWSDCALRVSYLKWFLPVVLELLQIVFRAATSVAHPAEPVREELPDVGDPVVVETVHHPFDDFPSLLRLTHISVPAQNGLLWARTFQRHGASLRRLIAGGSEAPFPGDPLFKGRTATMSVTSYRLVTPQSVLRLTNLGVSHIFT